jgi:hypothetical protein
MTLRQANRNNLLGTSKQHAWRSRSKVAATRGGDTAPGHPEHDLGRLKRCLETTLLGRR